MPQKDLKNATIKIVDGDATPETLNIRMGQGNLTWSESYPREYLPERGIVADGTVRDADQEPLELTIQGTWEFVKSTGTEPVTPYEALNRVGAASTWVSTGVDPCEPYAVDVEAHCGLNCTGTTTTLGELIIFPEFRVESVNFDMQAGTIEFSGKCKAVRPTVTRTTIT
jgi:hypothetical protein